MIGLHAVRVRLIIAVSFIDTKNLNSFYYHKVEKMSMALFEYKFLGQVKLLLPQFYYLQEILSSMR